jgi:hypothetical protein
MSIWYSFLRGKMTDVGRLPEDICMPAEDRITYLAEEGVASMDTGWFDPPPRIAAQPLLVRTTTSKRHSTRFSFMARDSVVEGQLHIRAPRQRGKA